MDQFEMFTRLIEYGTINVSRWYDYFDSNNQRLKKPKIHFEASSLIFANELFNVFELAKAEIGRNLIHESSQFKKLQFIRELNDRISLASKQITQNKNGDLEHNHFHHSSTITESKLGFTQKEFQNHYKIMKQYSEKMTSYLLGLREDVNAVYESGNDKKSFGNKYDNCMSPIEFFEDFITDDLIDTLWQEFQPNEDEKKHYYDVDIEKITGLKRFWYKDQVSGKLEYDSVFFENDFLLPIIKREEKASIGRIDEIIFQSTFELQKGYIKTVISRLEYLKSCSNSNGIIKNSIESIIRHCKIAYQDLPVIENDKVKIESKIIEKSVIDRVDSSNQSFKISRIPKNIEALKEIYNLKIGNIIFIDINMTNENDFIDYFTSKNVSESSFKIYTACKVNIVAYILSKMRLLFKGIKYKLIEESKAIITEQTKGTYLTASVISKSNTVTSNKNDFEDQQDIDNFFLLLKNKIQ